MDQVGRWQTVAAISNRAYGLPFTGRGRRPVTEGIPFLGFVVYPDRRCLKRRKGIHFRRRFRDLVQRYERGEIPLETVTASAQGWANHARYGNTVGLRKAVLGEAFSASQSNKE